MSRYLNDAPLRDLSGPFGALLLLTPDAIGSSKAAELDGLLLAAFLRWLPYERERLALIAADDCKPEWDVRFDALSGPWHDGMNAIKAMSARTPEGIRAKATVLRALLQNHVGLGGGRPDSASSSEAFAWSLVTDIVGKVGV